MNRSTETHATMLGNRAKPSILIVDPESRFLESIYADPASARAPPIVAMRGSDAQQILADKNQNFSAIFVNPLIQEPGPLSVIKFCHQNRPTLPVFLLVDERCPYSKDELARLGVRQVIQKPVKYARLLEIGSPQGIRFDPKKVVESSKGKGEALDTETEMDDSMFASIRAKDFLAGTKSLFDVYVRVNASKYIKVLNAGDAFQLERLDSYLKKGLEHFHIRKEAQENYVTYCDALMTAILKKMESNRISPKIAIQQAMNHGEQTFQFLRSAGLSETNLIYASSFAENVNLLATKIDPESDILAGFFKDLVSYEHAVSTAMVASLLGPALKLESEKLLHHLGLAAFLHDVGLYNSGAIQMTEKLMSEDEAVMSDEEKAVFRSHPTASADLLRSVRGIEPAVIQAVVQHHERIDGSGFPEGLGKMQISRLAEVVGIADEFARAVKKAIRSAGVNPFVHMEGFMHEKFSAPVVNAFIQVYVRKEFTADV